MIAFLSEPSFENPPEFVAFGAMTQADDSELHDAALHAQQYSFSHFIWINVCFP